MVSDKWYTDNGAAMTVTQFVDLASKLGLSGLLLAILYCSFKRIWVWGSELKAMEKERDEWKALALAGTDTLDTVTKYAIRERLRAQIRQSGGIMNNLPTHGRKRVGKNE